MGLRLSPGGPALKPKPQIPTLARTPKPKTKAHRELECPHRPRPSSTLEAQEPAGTNLSCLQRNPPLAGFKQKLGADDSAGNTRDSPE